MFGLKTREQLQSKLEELLGSENVYYQRPPSNGLKYPAILYSKSKIASTYADNKKYLMNTRYDVIVIDKRPDNPVIKKLLELPYCDYDRAYKSDNLYHDSLILYY